MWQDKGNRTDITVLDIAGVFERQQQIASKLESYGINRVLLIPL